MSGSPSIRFGILRARDLSELYWGARTVVLAKTTLNVVPNHSSPIAQQVLQNNPARIAYELFCACDGGGDGSLYLYPSADLTSSNALRLNVLTDSTIIINRDWTRYGDALTQELWAGSTGNQFHLTTVEYILTPTPVDEIP